MRQKLFMLSIMWSRIPYKNLLGFTICPCLIHDEYLKNQTYFKKMMSSWMFQTFGFPKPHVRRYRGHQVSTPLSLISTYSLF